MTELEKEILLKIENEGIESIKENSELWIYLNEKRVIKKERIIPKVPTNELVELQEGVPRKPLLKIIKEGTYGTCPKCNSTEIKRFIWFGKSIGCINSKCENYYE